MRKPLEKSQKENFANLDVNSISDTKKFWQIVHISNTEILNEERVKLLGVNLEGRLNFDFHVNTL